MGVIERLLLTLLVIVAIGGGLVFAYKNYAGPFMEYLFGTEKITISVRDVPLKVTVADTNAERKQGLGGVSVLPADEGMLFIFDQEGSYGFWMKDTLLPLDIMWINNEGKIVHIEENVTPDSYPAIYNSPYPARFVLETNAFFVTTFNLAVGDHLAIPAHARPADLQGQ